MNQYGVAHTIPSPGHHIVCHQYVCASHHPTFCRNIFRLQLTHITVFLFTLALFLSGYVLQQRTVTDLRKAIRPVAANYAPSFTLTLQAPPDDGDASEVPGTTAPERMPGESRAHGNGKGDWIDSYYEKDATQQTSHEKLLYVLGSTPSTTPPNTLSPSTNYLSSTNSFLAKAKSHILHTTKPYLRRADKAIHAWIRHIQGRELQQWEIDQQIQEQELEDVSKLDGVPDEELTAAQRRMRIKMDIRRLGVVEDGELKSVYRPRKRLEGR